MHMADNGDGHVHKEEAEGSWKRSARSLINRIRDKIEDQVDAVEGAANDDRTYSEDSEHNKE